MIQMVLKESIPSKSSCPLGSPFSQLIYNTKHLLWYSVDVAQELKTSKYADISNIDKAR